MFWSNARPHWMAELLPEANRRRRPDDVFHGDLADLGGALRGPLLHMLGYDVEARGPLFHELVVVQVFVDDDVQPGAGQRRVGAGTDGQPVFRASAPPGQTWVDRDDLGAHLDALHQPVADVAVGVGGQRLVAPHHQHLGRTELVGHVAVGMPLRGVDDGEVAHGSDAAAGARQVARIAREADVRHVRRLEGSLEEVVQLPHRAARRALRAQDGLGAVLFPHLARLALNDVVRLVPRDALPLVLATLTGALHGVLQTVRVVDGLDTVQAAHAQTTVRARIQRVALDELHLAVLHVVQQTARAVTARRRIVVRTRYGVPVLFPLVLPRVVRLAVDAVEKLFVVSHASLLSVPLAFAFLPENAPASRLCARLVQPGATPSCHHRE